MANQEKGRGAGQSNDGSAGIDDWKGDEVADAPPGDAEAAADRAAGRGPFDARRAQEEREAVENAEPAPTARLSRENRREQELKREAAVEDHAADRAAGTGTAPKKI